MAGITATLLGFLVVGVFFYVQRGIFPTAGQEAQHYLQAVTRTAIVLYGMTLALALGLVVLEPGWNSLLYAALSLVLLWSVIRTSLAIHRLHRVLGIRLMPQTSMWLAAAVVAAAPWALAGGLPSRTHLIVAMALLGVLAFSTSASLVLSTFDISRLEASAQMRLPPEAGPDFSDQPGSGRRGEVPSGTRAPGSSRLERSRS